MNQVITLAARFVEELRKDITPDQFVEVCKKNATPEYQGGVCASHDYCDANMTMLRAFEAVVGRPMIMDGGDSPQAQADHALWNAAWQYAHATKLRWGGGPRPEYVDDKGLLVAISEDDGDTISFYPSGGGFSYKMPRSKFFELFKVAPARTLRRGQVDADWMEDGETLPCWSYGSSWNGWGMPFFERAEVDKLIEQSTGEGLSPMRWDGDVVVVIDTQADEDDPDREVRIAPTLMSNGENGWDIGAGWWCWNRVQFDEETK